MLGCKRLQSDRPCKLLSYFPLVIRKGHLLARSIMMTQSLHSSMKKVANFGKFALLPVPVSCFPTLTKRQTFIQGDHSPCAKPPVVFKTKVPLWPGQARPGQSGTFVLKSTGSFALAEWSPCRGRQW